MSASQSSDDRNLIANQLPKSLTGIRGFDEITNGGLPKGRPTLVCGSAGSGKTLFGMEFLVRGATQFDEPGVMVSFEETAEDLAKNVASLGFDVDDLVARGKMSVDYVYIERSEIEETGEYDLEGLFIRLAYAIDSIGAKRVVLDTLEALFAGLPNQSILRAEIRRLFRWLKERGVTAVITAEAGKGTLTRHGLEEYVSDCVIALDHRVQGEIATRRLRVVKYRGSLHGTNEYPFLIDEGGISVLPITSLGLSFEAPSERVSTGIPRLDGMLGGEGFYRGSSVLVSGTAGTGKTSLAACFANEACRRGEKALYFAFEESQKQIVRNMRSIGLDLEPWVQSGLLRFHAARPSEYGLEMHLAVMHKLIREFEPEVVVIDPISNLIAVGEAAEVKSALTRLIDFLKMKEITSLYASLLAGGSIDDSMEVGVSSLMDTWILLRDLEQEGERNRAIYVLKSRGMGHSNQVREFIMSDRGIELVDVYVGGGRVLAGAARAAQEAREREARLILEQEFERKKREIEQQRKTAEMELAVIRARMASQEEEYRGILEQERLRRETAASEREKMASLRKADRPAPEHEDKTQKGGK